MPARKKRGRGRGQPKLAKGRMTVKDVSSISLTDELNLSGACGVQGGGDDGDGSVVEAGVAPVAMSPKSVQLSIPLTPPTTVDPDVWSRIFIRQFDIDETGDQEDDEDEFKSIREEFGLVRPIDRSSPDPPSLAIDFKFNPFILKEMGLQLALEKPDLYRKHLPYECDSSDDNDDIDPGSGKERQNTVTPENDKNGTSENIEDVQIDEDDYQIEVIPGPSRACRKPPDDAPLTLPVHPPLPPLPPPSSISDDVEDVDLSVNEKDKVNNVTTKHAKNKRKRSGSKRKRKGKAKVRKTVVPAKIAIEVERWNSLLDKEVFVAVERVRSQPGREELNSDRSSQKRKSLSPGVKQRPQKRKPIEVEDVNVLMGHVTLARLASDLLSKETNEARPPVVSTEEDVLVPASPPRDTTSPSSPPPPEGRTSTEKIQFSSVVEKMRAELTITTKEVDDNVEKGDKNTPNETEVPSTSPPSLPSPPPPPPPPPEESPEDKDNSTTTNAATDIGEEAASGECEDQGSEDNRDSIKTNPGSTPDQFLSDFEATPEHPPPSQSPPPPPHSPPTSTEELPPPPEVNPDAQSQITEKSTEDAVHKGADAGAGAIGDVSVNESLPDAVARVPSTSSTSSSSDNEDDASNDTGSETEKGVSSRIKIKCEPKSPQHPTPSPPPPPSVSIKPEAMTTNENLGAVESDTVSVSSCDSGDTAVLGGANIKKEIVESGSRSTLNSEAEATDVHDHAHDTPADQLEAPQSPPLSENSSVPSPPASPCSSEETKPELPPSGNVEDIVDLNTCSRAAFYGCIFCDKIYPCYRDDLLRTHCITKHNTDLELSEDHLRMKKYEYRDILQCQKCGTLIRHSHMDAHHKGCEPRLLKETLFDKPTVPEDGGFFERYRCEKSLCSSSERFDSKYLLRLHLHTAHSDIELDRKAIIFPDFRCATCLKIFESSDSLLKHCVLPCQDKPLAETILEVAKRAQDCELCGVRHVRIAEATNCFQRRSMMRCVLCFDILKHKRFMTQHLKTYHAKSDQKNSGLDHLLIDCPFCNFPRDRYPAVFTHINRVHFYPLLPNQEYDDEDDEAVIEMPKPPRRASADTQGSARIYPEVQEMPSITIQIKSTDFPLVQNQNGLPPVVQLQPRTSTSPVPMPVPQLTRGLSRPGSASPQPQQRRPLPPLIRGGAVPPSQRIVRTSIYRGQVPFQRHPVPLPPGISGLRSRPTLLPFRRPLPPNVNHSRRPAVSISTVSPQRSSSPTPLHLATASTSTASPQGNLSISPVTPKIVSVKSMASGGTNQPQNNNNL